MFLSWARKKVEGFGIPQNAVAAISTDKVYTDGFSPSLLNGEWLRVSDTETRLGTDFTSSNNEYLEVDDHADFSLGGDLCPVFNGTTQYLSIPNASLGSLDLTGTDFSIETWIYYPSAFNGTDFIVSKYEYSTNQRAYALVNYLNGNLGFYVSHNGYAPTLIQSTGALNEQDWYHCVARYQATGYLDLFLNNEIQSSGTQPTPGIHNSSADFHIGIGDHNAFNPLGFTGRVGPTRIWNRFITTDEINTLYNNHNGQTYSDITGVISNTGTYTGTIDDNLVLASDMTGTNLEIGPVSDFTNNGSVTFDQLSITNHKEFSTAGWVKVDDPTPDNWMTVFSKWSTTDRAWILLHEDSSPSSWSRQNGTANRLNFLFTDGGNAIYALAATDSLVADTWTFVSCRYDATGNRAILNLNGSQYEVSGAHWGIRNSTQPLSFGFGSGSNKFDGSLSSIGYWNRCLTDAEIAELYNSGTGVDWNDISGGSLGDAKAWWECNEYSDGTSQIDRLDKVGEKTAIDHGTCPSIYGHVYSDTPNGYKVSRWGNFEQSDQTKMPILSGNKVEFNGTHSLTGNPPYITGSIYVVGEINNPTGYFVGVSETGLETGVYLGERLNTFIGGVQNQEVQDLTAHTELSIYNMDYGNAITLRRQEKRVDQISQNNTLTQTGQLMLGAVNITGAATYGMSGSISELIYTSGNTTVTQNNDVFKYLAQKYKIDIPSIETTYTATGHDLKVGERIWVYDSSGSLTGFQTVQSITPNTFTTSKIFNTAPNCRYYKAGLLAHWKMNEGALDEFDRLNIQPNFDLSATTGIFTIDYFNDHFGNYFQFYFGPSYSAYDGAFLEPNVPSAKYSDFTYSLNVNDTAPKMGSVQPFISGYNALSFSTKIYSEDTGNYDILNIPGSGIKMSYNNGVLLEVADTSIGPLGTIPTGEWKTITAVINYIGDRVDLYVDSDSSGTTGNYDDFPSFINNNPCNLGTGQFLLSDMRLYNYPLTSTEVNVLHSGYSAYWDSNGKWTEPKWKLRNYTPNANDGVYVTGTLQINGMGKANVLDSSGNLELNGLVTVSEVNITGPLVNRGTLRASNMNVSPSTYTRYNEIYELYGDINNNLYLPDDIGKLVVNGTGTAVLLAGTGFENIEVIAGTLDLNGINYTVEETVLVRNGGYIDFEGTSGNMEQIYLYGPSRSNKMDLDYASWVVNASERFIISNATIDGLTSTGVTAYVLNSTCS